MKTNWGQLIILFMSNLLFFLGVNSMNILPAYLEDQGAGGGITGLFSTVPILFLVLLVVLQLLRGRTFHKIRLARIGFLCTLTAMGGMILFLGNLPVMFLFYLLTGLTYAAGFTGLFAMMYDLVPQENWRSGATIFGISGLASSGVASFLSQWVYQSFPDYVIFLLPALFSTAALLFSLFLKASNYTLIEQRSFSFKEFFHTKGIGPLVLQALIFGGGFGIFKTFMPLITEERLGQVDITRFFGFFTLVGLIYRLIFVRWIDRFRYRTLMTVGLVLMGAGLFFLGRISSMAHLYLIGAAYGLAHSLLFPGIAAEFVKNSGGHRAAFNNVFLALFTLGLTGFSSGLGFLGDFWGLERVPLVMAAIIILPLASLFLSGRTKTLTK